MTDSKNVVGGGASREEGTTPRSHELKTWPDYYECLVDGTKTFEYRRDDRGFKVGDTLYLREWEPTAWSIGVATLGRYTGREMRRRVTYLLHAGTDFVVMALAEVAEASARPAPPLPKCWPRGERSPGRAAGRRAGARGRARSR